MSVSYVRIYSLDEVKYNLTRKYPVNVAWFKYTIV